MPSDNRKAKSRKKCVLTAWFALSKLYGQADGSISTGQLNTLLCLHTQPINLVVFQGSHREN